MAYCTTTDVISMFYELPNTADINAKITDAEISTWIDEESGLLDAELKYKYRVPLTGTQSLLIAKVIVQYIVSARVFSTIQKSTGKIFKFDDKTFDTLKYNQGKELYKKLKNNEIILSDSDLLSAPNKSYMTKNTKKQTLPEDKDMTHKWHKNEIQW